MRICLVGATQPSFNPRLVREADSLVEAGYQVRVVAPRSLAWADGREEALMRRRTWQLDCVDYRPVGSKLLRAAYLRGRARLARAAFRLIKSDAVASRANCLAASELLGLAAREPADWFIAHAQPALPIAARAAQRWAARLGFDCEDLLGRYPGEQASVVRVIESRYLPLCDYVSAPSCRLADELARTYGIQAPIVLHNVFPLRMAAALAPPSQRPTRSAVRLHWFGQTIGPDRGLQDAIQALTLLPENCELHLRGEWVPGFRPQLDSMVRSLGLEKRVTFHSLADHDDLIGTMSEFDIGLALERPERENASLTVSNKLFSYLLAGLAVAATDTPGQRDILQQVPAAGFLYPAGHVRTLAERLGSWIEGREKLRSAQQAAWGAARSRFCWDIEQRSFFAIFDGRARQAAHGGSR